MGKRFLSIEKSEKYCPDCNEIKSRSEFGKNKTAKDGLTFQCRKCTNIRNRTRRLKQKVIECGTYA